jgi:hypothetical protein
VDAAVWPCEKGPDIWPFVIGGIVPDNVDHSLACVKSLSAQAFKDRVERESFRRGVESLFYLNSCNKPVAPKYLFHTNVPMSVGMEYVEGTTVNDLFDADRNAVRENWLDLALSAFMAVLACHKSEGGVLHRDIKPKNIILEGIYYGAGGSEIANSSVRFINFDMSWHKFSSGNTKPLAADEVGYYAPEQRISANAGTPRSSKTDVYMLGMLLVYLMSEAPPPEGGAKLDGWDDYIIAKVRGRLQDPLAANRLSRLITKMTAVDPENRPDLTEAIADLEVLKPVLSEDCAAVDPDVFIEKILTSTDYDYDWDDLLLEGMLKTPRQIELKLGFKQRGQLAIIGFTRARDEGMNRKNFGGRLGVLISEANNELRNYGWVTDTAGGYHSRSITATIQVSALRENAVKGIYQTKRLIPFDPAAQDVVLHGLPIQDVLVLFCLCQPDGKMTDRCPARRSTRVFPMRKRARSIWRTDGGRTASFAPLAAPARAGL